jgi:hypothetical protein
MSHRYHHYQKRQKVNRAWWKLWGVLGILSWILIFIIFHGYAEADKQASLAKLYKQQAQQEATRTDNLIASNKQLITQRDIATASAAIVHPTLSNKAFDTIVGLIFPPEAALRYKTIVTKCENSTRDPIRTNHNKNNTYDLGVSQINQVHTSQVEAMFNESFWTAMSDSVKNMVFAAWMYHTQGNFSAWSCEKILSDKGII